MKNIFVLTWLFLVVFLLGSCRTSDLNYTDVQVTAVNSLFEPIDNKAVKLVSSSTASLFFEWEAALSEDGGAPLYEVVFDKVGGDFSKPLYKLTSNNNGFSNNAYVTHKVLNAVAISAGVNPGESGEVQWTVISSRGINRVQSSAIRKLSIGSLEGFADIPDELYISGEGSEGGTSVGTALPFKQTAAGEYEIYTRLEAGKEYVFLDRRDDNARVFFSDDQVKLKEGTAENAMQISQTGVYQIKLDFNVATIGVREIKSIGVWFSPENRILFNLPYAGKGIWTGTGNITFKQEGWGRDERYKFQLETVVNGKTEIQQMGARNSTDSRPNAASQPSYYYIKLLNAVTQWDDKWKFADAVDGKSNTVSVILQGDKEYTHTIKVN